MREKVYNVLGFAIIISGLIAQIYKYEHGACLVGIGILVVTLAGCTPNKEDSITTKKSTHDKGN